MAWTLSDCRPPGRQLHGEDRRIAAWRRWTKPAPTRIAFVTGAKHADALRASALAR